MAVSPAGRDVPRRRDAGAGIVAVAVALGMSELLAGAVVRAASPVVAVGDAVVDRVPAWLKDTAIAIFGTGDKVALLVGVVGACAAVGAVVGVYARRHFTMAVIAFAGVAAAGAAAALGDPRASAVATAGILVPGVAAGLWTLRALQRTAVASDAVRGRRAFLRSAGAALVVAAVTAWTGRLLTRRSAAAVSRAEVALPAPRLSAPPQPRSAEVGVAGVEPFRTPVDTFYRIDTALAVPRVDAATWRMGVTGMVDRPREWSLAQLLDHGLEEHWTTLCCVSNEVGGHLIGNAVWGGVPLREILDLAGVQVGATQVVGRSVDGWTAGFPTEVVYDGRAALVAVTMNGEPLPIEHGFPARLVVPGLYGYVSATKWLSEIELTTWDAFDAYWVPRGWSKEGPVKTQSRIDVPRPGPVTAGRVAVAGVAWAQQRGIERVEVSVDEGQWHAATLGDVPNVDTWRQWVWHWDATPGSHVLQVRATDSEGQVQTAQRRPVMPDGATGHHRVLVQVRAA